MKKTIVYVGGFIFPDGNAAAHRVLSNAKLFRQLGFEVILIGVTKNDVDHKILKTRKFAQGFEYYEVAYPNSSLDWINYISKIEHINAVINEIGIDTIHSIVAYEMPALQLYRLQKICKNTCINVISDCVEWRAPSFNNRIRSFLIKIDNDIRLRLLNNRCEGIICISTMLMNHYSLHRNTILLPPLVDKSESKWPLSIKTLLETKEFTYVGSPGSGLQKEYFDLIIEAFSSLEENCNFKFNIIGVSREEVKGKSISISRNIEKLANKITFFDKVDNSRCISMINTSHFFIFMRPESILSKSGFPTKFVESITSGTPVLTNKTSDLNDYLIEGKNGFWLENNLNSVTAIIRSCIDMDDYDILQMKRFCLESDVFDYHRYLDQMNRFLKNLRKN